MRQHVVAGRRSTVAATLTAAILLSSPVGMARAEPAEAPVSTAHLPSFVEASALGRLEAALFASARRAGSGAGEAEELHAPSFGAGMSSYLPELLRDGSAAAMTELTTADFSSTLQQARRDTGEVKALADEVRTRAEEISLRFAGGASDEDTAALAKAAALVKARTLAAAALGNDGRVPGSPPADASGRSAAQLIAQPAAAAAMGQGPRPAVVETVTAAVVAVSPSGSIAADPGQDEGLPSSGQTAPATLPGGQVERATPVVTAAAAATLDGRMALGHEPPPAATLPVAAATDSVAAAGIEIIVRSAPVAAPPPERRRTTVEASPSKRLPGMAAAPRKRKDERAPPAVSARMTARAAPAAATSGARGLTAAAQPPIVKTSTEAAITAAAATAAEAPKPASGGLFSSLKPFQFPRELGSLGWSSDD
jgi:hypothetical protein